MTVPMAARDSAVTVTAPSVADGQRKVLMLVSAFPPGPQCIIRTLKFARYLPEFGWQPVVLTPWQQAATSGPSVESVPDGTLVVRTRRLPTLSQVARRLVGSRASAAPPAGTDDAPAARPGLGARLNGLLRSLLIWGDTPDVLVGWLPFAVLRGWWLIRRHRIAAIHASGPPFTPVLAGLFLSKLTGLPLVADFRDTWMQDASDPFGTISGQFRCQRSPRRERVMLAMERWALRAACAVLYTSRATRRLYQDAYPAAATRGHLIYNGADEEDYSAGAAPFERPTFVHVGTIHEYQWDQVRMLLEGFALGRRDGRIPADARVALVGPVAPLVKSQVEDAAARLSIEQCVELTGSLPHKDAVSWLQRSQVLVMFVGENPYVRLTKISEYVAAGRPMLAFAPQDSETGQEVKSYGGAVLSGDPPDAVAERLGALLAGGIQRPSAGGTLSGIAHPHPLNRRTNAETLAKILDASTGTRGADGLR